ncbi:MAG: FumA C-terminus/TtdB family hydratase beta subunit [bacterium]
MSEGKVRKLTAPLSEENRASLRAGQELLLSGYIYGARDAAHRRLCQSIESKEHLPFDLKGQIFYYTGPTPVKQGSSRAVGAAGPTTSYRMDPYTPLLLEHGLKGAIGKGPRSREVTDAFIKTRAIYFIAIGGLGALLSRRIKSAQIVAYEDLGTEAVWRFYIEDFPVIVAIDIVGNDIYKIEGDSYVLS